MESSVLKTEADFFPNSWFDHHGGFLHFEEREDRKKQNAEEMEFVKVLAKGMSTNGHLITSYIGSFKPLKENGPLWAYFQQYLYEEYIDLFIEDSFEEGSLSTPNERNSDRMSLQENVNKLDPRATCLTITQYGFSFINTSTLDSTKTHYD